MSSSEWLPWVGTLIGLVVGWGLVLGGYLVLDWWRHR